MKKLMFLFVCLLSMQVVMADNDKLITVEKLPQKAQEFVKTHFAKADVAFTKMEREFLDSSYEIMFVNGDKIEFDKSGNWKEIQCKRQSVPDAIVPAKIKAFIQENYPDAKVLQIEKDRYEYEVRLSNYWELTFDLEFNLIDMDQDD